MNSGKKSTAIIVAVIAVVVIVAIIWAGGSSNQNTPAEFDSTANGTSSAPVSETVKVSNTLSEYQNAELGFSVKYPSAWEKEETNSGINFIIPIDKNQVSTVATLQANIQVLSSPCEFPPVTTVQDRSTLAVGGLSLKTISMSNTVQGREYYNRMYSLQKGDICYMFSFASIALSPASKNLTSSQATQANNNNKAIVVATESDFTNMVKSFAFVTGPAGTDETKAAPAQGK
ncbi:hypothetical protein KGQ27_01505 [Patescibacteria group bacterium]|nr:hypothetical protein [Patescibacteria group bacterium]MDE1946482.1 hypothetical protein [Patescibacteria group bacterium]MDE2011166.1 hypothetical protein [Patescibacteria group bacterium]MDE2233548.1 hypothetical protein [Patescibacteria group bacterium]